MKWDVTWCSTVRLWHWLVLSRNPVWELFKSSLPTCRGDCVWNEEKWVCSTGQSSHTQGKERKARERQAVGVWIFQAVNLMIHNHLFVTHISQEVSGDSTPLSLSLWTALNYYVVSCHKRYKAQHSTFKQLHVILSEWLQLPRPVISRSGIAFPFHYWDHVRTYPTSPSLGAFIWALLWWWGDDATTGSLDTSGQELFR